MLAALDDQGAALAVRAAVRAGPGDRCSRAEPERHHEVQVGAGREFATAALRANPGQTQNGATSWLVEWMSRTRLR